MKADLTRYTFDPTKHFIRVVMQQGRVQLDADPNEQTAILFAYLTSLAADLIGPHGGPTDNLGFQVAPNASLTQDFDISAGHYYVDGLLCELDSKTTYTSQPDYPNPPVLKVESYYQIYLDVWERTITWVEDDSIREVALNGADTAARTRLICQVRATPAADEGCISADTLKGIFQPADRGSLKVVAKQQAVSTNPCVIAPDASYSGPENQLYRVEIHTGSFAATGDPATPTFKWSRENGSVIFPIVSLATSSGTTTVVLENMGRDDRFGLTENDWVEILDDDYVLQNNAAPLLKVQGVDPGSLTVTLSGTPVGKTGQTATRHPLLRRWDQTFGDPAQNGLQQDSTDNAAKILEGSGDTNWLTLENGIQIQFQPAPTEGGKNTYRTGDYWLIPARTATGNVEWPDGKALPPKGVDHHYAPLARIHVLDKSISADSCQFEFPAYAKPVKPAT
jgi:hypothetical protein